MFQQSQSLSSEITRYRLILFSALMVYPGWSLVIKTLEPHLNPYHEIRMTVAGFVFLCLAASFFIKKNLVAYLKFSLQVCCFVAAIQASWFLYISHAPYVEYCGYIILMGTMISIMPTKKSAVFFGLGALIYTIILSQLDQAWLIDRAFLPLGMLITLIPSLLGTLTRLNHLEEIEVVQQQQSILFANLEEGVIVFDERGQVKSVNPAALKILDLSHQEIQSGKFKNEALFAIAQQAMTSPETVKNQMISIEKNNKISWYHVNATSYFIQKKQQYGVVTFTDMTSMKEFQELVSYQRSQLFSTAKLSALGEMATGIAHEINNPLAIIAGKVALISRDLETQQNEKTPEHLKKISETVMRIKKIINGLQTFARGGEHEPFTETHLHSMITEVLSFCRERIYHQDIQVDLQIPIDLWVECRSGQISQVLVNLINNSSDAAKASQDKWIRITAEKKEDLVQIFVTDSGLGIQADLKDKIMEPFFTTKEVGKGTGLGLSISRGIITSHGGRFELVKNSDPTTFMIEIPLRQTHIKAVS